MTGNLNTWYKFNTGETSSKIAAGIMPSRCPMPCSCHSSKIECWGHWISLNVEVNKALKSPIIYKISWSSDHHLLVPRKEHIKTFPFKWKTPVRYLNRIREQRISVYIAPNSWEHFTANNTRGPLDSWDHTIDQHQGRVQTPWINYTTTLF